MPVDPDYVRQKVKHYQTSHTMHVAGPAYTLRMPVEHFKIF